MVGFESSYPIMIQLHLEKKKRITKLNRDKGSRFKFQIYSQCHLYLELFVYNKSIMTLIYRHGPLIQPK